MITDVLLSPVIPALVAQQRTADPNVSPAADGGPRRVLPLAGLPALRSAAMVYGMASVDCHGRLADRTVLRALGWSAGQRLGIREHGGLVVIHADPHAVFRVTGQGYLQLPAAARRWCGLVTGDRVLLAADPARGRLVVHPPTALDALIAGCHADLLDGERP
ncbi:MAG: AbrB/MazE/SpoVT family DNA-binding domain-containing protein [Sciscionella sp.]